MDKRILVINPGSTSTKLALFQGEQKLFDAAVRHSKEDLSPFSWVMEQADFRQTAIEKELSAHNVDLTTLDAVCARGGQLPYCAAGTYLVDQDMVDFMYTVRDAAHASNLGCVLALRIASWDDVQALADYQYMLTKPVCFVCDDTQLLEAALRAYQGRALYDGALPEDTLLPLCAKYGLLL